MLQKKAVELQQQKVSFVDCDIKHDFSIVHIIIGPSFYIGYQQF